MNKRSCGYNIIFYMYIHVYVKGEWIQMLNHVISSSTPLRWKRGTVALILILCKGSGSFIEVLSWAASETERQAFQRRSSCRRGLLRDFVDVALRRQPTKTQDIYQDVIRELIKVGKMTSNCSCALMAWKCYVISASAALENISEVFCQVLPSFAFHLPCSKSSVFINWVGNLLS